jgi:Tol biopolymer transport system component
LLAQPFDPETLEPIGEAVDVSEPGMGNPPYEWAFAPDGTLVYARMTTDQRSAPTLMFVDENGTGEPISMPSFVHADRLRLSPDGRRFVYGAQNAGTRVKDVWIYNLEFESQAKVTFHPDIEESPIWTPDGERIVFTSDRDGKADLYWKKVDSDGPAERLTDMDPRSTPVAHSFTADGEILFFSDWGPSELGCDLWTVSVNENPPRVERLKSGEGCLWHPLISPDGRWLAFLWNAMPRIAPYPAMDRFQPITEQAATSLAWNPDGSSIYYLDNWGNIVEVEIQTEPAFSFRPFRVVLEGTFDSLDITPDGKTFLVIKTELGEPITELVVVENWFEELKRKAPPNR